jgi:hypothetical protein
MKTRRIADQELGRILNSGSSEQMAEKLDGYIRRRMEAGLYADAEKAVGYSENTGEAGKKYDFEGLFFDLLQGCRSFDTGQIRRLRKDDYRAAVTRRYLDVLLKRNPDNETMHMVGTLSSDAAEIPAEVRKRYNLDEAFIEAEARFVPTGTVGRPPADTSYGPPKAPGKRRTGTAGTRKSRKPSASGPRMKGAGNLYDIRESIREGDGTPPVTAVRPPFEDDRDMFDFLGNTAAARTDGPGRSSYKNLKEEAVGYAIGRLLDHDRAGAELVLKYAGLTVADIFRNDVYRMEIIDRIATGATGQSANGTEAIRALIEKNNLFRNQGDIDMLIGLFKGDLRRKIGNYGKFRDLLVYPVGQKGGQTATVEKTKVKEDAVQRITKKPRNRIEQIIWWDGITLEKKLSAGDDTELRELISPPAYRARGITWDDVTGQPVISGRQKELEDELEREELEKRKR